MIPSPRRMEVNPLKTIDIAIRDLGHISTLVNITNRYPFVIQLRQGRHVVDGKSVLGVYSLEHTKPITVEMYSDHCDQLMEELNTLMC